MYAWEMKRGRVRRCRTQVTSILTVIFSGKVSGRSQITFYCIACTKPENEMWPVNGCLVIRKFTFFCLLNPYIQQSMDLVVLRTWRVVYFTGHFTATFSRLRSPIHKLPSDSFDTLRKTKTKQKNHQNFYPIAPKKWVICTHKRNKAVTQVRI